MNNSEPKPVRSEINRLAHARALIYETQVRMHMRQQIRELTSSGISYEEALQKLYDSPPFVDPGY